MGRGGGSQSSTPGVDGPEPVASPLPQRGGLQCAAAWGRCLPGHGAPHCPLPPSARHPAPPPFQACFLRPPRTNTHTHPDTHCRPGSPGVRYGLLDPLSHTISISPLLQEPSPLQLSPSTSCPARKTETRVYVRGGEEKKPPHTALADVGVQRAREGPGRA